MRHTIKLSSVSTSLWNVYYFDYVSDLPGSL